MGSNVKENSFQKNPLWSKLDSFSKKNRIIFIRHFFLGQKNHSEGATISLFNIKVMIWRKLNISLKIFFSLWVETSGPRSAPGRTQPTPLVSWYLQGCSGRREVPDTVFRSYVKENSRKTLKKNQNLSLGLRGPSGALLCGPLPCIA